MALALTAPGVYIQELPSGSRSISGVSTSLTAFVGAALRGPIDVPTLVDSFSAFDRLFGGLSPTSAMTHAVRHYFLNGGGEALIVRVPNRDEDTADAIPLAATVRVTAPAALGTFTLEAANPGAWGNSLRVRTSVQDAAAGTFHLIVREVDGDGNTVAEETHHGVTLVAGPRTLADVLASSSALAVRVTDSGATAVDASTTAQPFVDGADGEPPRIEDILGDEATRTGMHALRNADIFNLLCIPLTGGWATSDAGAAALWDAASLLCEQRRAFLIVDPPSDWSTAAAAITGANALPIRRSNNAALYFPEVMAPDPLQEGRLRAFPPSGTVAGVIARTDAQRGVWKSPAGIETNLAAVPDLRTRTTDAEQGRLNSLGINVLRRFAVYGSVVWGARTLRGADALASEWKYLGVRRLALYLHESLYRGTQWAVFEPNDFPLWGQLRTSIGAFMHTLFRQGAFAGKSAREAYLVKCDAETTTPGDIERGIVNVIIGFAPLRPAEFVFIKLQQIVAQVA